jgi:glutaredoxin
MYTIITKDDCPFCGSAKALLDKINQGYTEYNVHSPSSMWVLTLLKRSSIKTVPQIFSSDGSLIGGYAELRVFLDPDLTEGRY